MNMSPARVSILPPGIELPDGRVLTFPASRRCPCRDCAAAFRAYADGTLEMLADRPGEVPW